MSSFRARHVSVGVLVLLVLLFSKELWAKPNKLFELKVGEQLSIPANRVDKYSEGKKGVVDIRLPKDGEEFIVVGVFPGTTTMLLIMEDGTKVTYAFEVKAQASDVPHRENIQLDFYFVEVKSGGQYQVGIAWPASIGADMDLRLGLNSDGLTAASASISGLPLPRLDVLHRNNWAKIVRQASVIAANGEKAEFNSGGEVNIAIEGSLAAELRQIPYGTKVNVLPRYDRESGRLELRIDAEVSSLGEGRVPTRNRSTVSTVVNVEMNQAIVLAGLYSEAEAKNRSGLPFLSQIPVLGALLGSHGARREEVQNVIFIVPSIVDVVAMKARSRIQDALKAYAKFHGDMRKTKIAPQEVAEEPR